jgi:hypothetical protein
MKMKRLFAPFLVLCVMCVCCAAQCSTELSASEAQSVFGGCSVVHCCRWLNCNAIPCDTAADCPYIPGPGGGTSYCASSAMAKWCSLNDCHPAYEQCCSWCLNEGTGYWYCGEYYEGPQVCDGGTCSGGTPTGIDCSGEKDCQSG